MVHHELFNFIFPPGPLAELLKSQANVKEWIESVDKVLQKAKYIKGQVLQSIGQTPEYIFFLTQGTIRAYYYNEEGKQCTFYLWSDFSIATDIVNYLMKKPSDLYIEVCEESAMLFISRTSLDQIIQDSPGSVLFLYAIVLTFAEHHREREKDFQSTNAEERLLKLEKIKKKLELKFPRNWIASYLRISRSLLYDIKGRKRK